jgi:hypothetical protein
MVSTVMHTGLTAENRAALDRWGARKILGALANVSAEAQRNVEDEQKFIANYGPLYLGSATPPFDVGYYAGRFRLAWTVKDLRDPQAVEAVNRFLNDIFAIDFLSGNPDELPAISADFSTGKWEPVVRNLLDVLARELMRSRKMLHRCERPECARYMVKEFSRDRYCSRSCAEEMRSRSQVEWAQQNRHEIKRRRRKGKKQ